MLSRGAELFGMGGSRVVEQGGALSMGEGGIQVVEWAVLSIGVR